MLQQFDNASTSSYPKITIITPSLNQGDFIEDTICSVLSQQYPNLEYVIMDGLSKDNTLSILKKYTTELKWVSEKDQGQTNAINKGINNTDGAIICYLNADDILLPGTLWKVANLFSNNPKIMWVTGKCRIVNEANEEIRSLVTLYKNTLLRFSKISLLLMTNYISQPATFWRREVLSDVGLMDESLHYVMDYEYWLRLYSKYPPAFIQDYLASFRVHSLSKTAAQGHKKDYIEEEKRVVQRYTSSHFLRYLHDAHRFFVTMIYTFLSDNRK